METKPETSPTSGPQEIRPKGGTDPLIYKVCLFPVLFFVLMIATNGIAVAVVGLVHREDYGMALAGAVATGIALLIGYGLLVEYRDLDRKRKRQLRSEYLGAFGAKIRPTENAVGFLIFAGIVIGVVTGILGAHAQGQITPPLTAPLLIAGATALMFGFDRMRQRAEIRRREKKRRRRGQADEALASAAPPQAPHASSDFFEDIMGPRAEEKRQLAAQLARATTREERENLARHAAELEGLEGSAADQFTAGVLASGDDPPVIEEETDLTEKKEGAALVLPSYGKLRKMKLIDGIGIVVCALLGVVVIQLHGLRQAMPATRGELEDAWQKEDVERALALQGRSVLIHETGLVTVVADGAIEVEGTVAIDGEVKVDDSSPVEVEVSNVLPLDVEIQR